MRDVSGVGYIVHPVDEHVVEVTLDLELNASEVIEHLLEAKFIVPYKCRYQLAVRGGVILHPSISLATAGINSHSPVRVTLRVLPRVND
jgi:hypothetical protein